MNKDKKDNYEINCESACKKDINDPIDCKNAEINTGYSSTLNIKSVTCDKNCKIHTYESSTTHIESLECEGNCDIKVDHSSTLTIKSLICKGKNCTINADYASTIIIDGANISGHADISSQTHFLGGCTVKIKGTVNDRTCHKGWSSTLLINGKTCE